MAVIAVIIFLAQIEGRDPATFLRRVAEFDGLTARRAAATVPDERSTLTLEWLRALQNVIRAIPIERVDGPHLEWLKGREGMLVYSEPAGEWLIHHDLLERLHDEHSKSAAADEIAWLAVTNGLPGECEGYVPCYAASLNLLEGEYLRRHPEGAHRVEAFDRVSESLRSVVDDLLKRPERADYLNVPRDCGDLLESTRPLREAIAAAGGGKTDTMVFVERLIGQCPK